MWTVWEEDFYHNLRWLLLSSLVCSSSLSVGHQYDSCVYVFWDDTHMFTVSRKRKKKTSVIRTPVCHQSDRWDTAYERATEKLTEIIICAGEPWMCHRQRCSRCMIHPSCEQAGGTRWWKTNRRSSRSAVERIGDLQSSTSNKVLLTLHANLLFVPLCLWYE